MSINGLRFRTVSGWACGFRVRRVRVICRTVSWLWGWVSGRKSQEANLFLHSRHLGGCTRAAYRAAAAFRLARVRCVAVRLVPLGGDAHRGTRKRGSRACPTMCFSQHKRRGTL